MLAEENIALNGIMQAEEASKEQTKEVLSLRTEIEAIAVIDQVSFESASGMLKKVKGQLAIIEKKRKDLKRPIIDAGKAVEEHFREVLTGVKAVELLLKGKINVYLTEQQKIQRQLEREAQERADREAARLEKYKQNAINRGDLKKSEEFHGRKEAVATAPVEPVVQKVSGIHQTATYRAELTSLGELVKAAAEGRVSAMDCLTFDQTAANRLARECKGASTTPGVRFIKETGISSGRN